MKTILALMLFAVAVIYVTNKAKTVGYTKDQQRFFNALHMVESSGIPDGTFIRGELGELGALQISYDFWFDATSSKKSTVPQGEYKDVVKLEYAYSVIDNYFKRYCKEYWNECDAHVYQLSRIYNGGPRGMTKQSTKDYANRVYQIYEGMK